MKTIFRRYVEELFEYRDDYREEYEGDDCIDHRHKHIGYDREVSLVAQHREEKRDHSNKKCRNHSLINHIYSLMPYMEENQAAFGNSNQIEE